MLNIADTLHSWCGKARPFALATVVGVSAPLPPGTALAVDADGNAAGSISGGCVEGAVYDLCREILDSGGPPQRARFGYSDSDAFAVGLTCGGELDVLVQRVEPTAVPHLTRALEAVGNGRPSAVAQVVDGPAELLGRMLSLVGYDGAHEGTLGGGTRADAAVAAQARALLHAGRTGRIEMGGDGDTCPEHLSVLVHVNASSPPDADLRRGRLRRRPQPGRLVPRLPGHGLRRPPRLRHWPHRYLDRTEVDTRTAVCVLTHDAKFDIPLLSRALELPVGYVGAMGSRRTHEQRLERLREAGVLEAQLARLHSPIGLDLGARTPEETAISIAAEIIAHTSRGTGRPLSHGTGPIHRTDPVLSQARA